jgi:hypothetical protein
MVKLPAGTITISGHAGQSLNPLMGPGSDRTQCASPFANSPMPSHVAMGAVSRMAFR